MTTYTIEIRAYDEIIGAEIKKQITDLIEKYCSENNISRIDISSNCTTSTGFGKNAKKILKD